MRGFRGFVIMALICVAIGIWAAKSCGVADLTTCTVNETTGVDCE